MRLPRLHTRSGNLEVLLFQSIALLVLPFVVYHFSGSVPFVQECPSQYGKLVLSIFMAGILTTGLSYFAYLVFDDLRRLSKAALALGVLPIGGIGLALWQGLFSDDKLDLLAVLTAFLAFCGAAARLAESWPWTRSSIANKQALLFVELPILIVCVAVVLFKYLFFDWSTEEFSDLIAGTFPHAEYRTPRSQRLMEEYLTLVRSGFWIGFSTGVVTVQLLAGQVIAIVLRAWHMSNATSVDQGTKA